MTRARHTARQDATPQLAVALEGGRAAYGLVQLGHPHRMARTLGARLLVQALGTALVADRLDAPARGGLHALGGGVDVLHGTSMLGLALVSPGRRAWALRQAAGAAVLATVELALALSCSGARSWHPRTTLDHL